PSAPAARRKTTRLPSSPNTAATGSPRGNCRSAQRCARPRRCWRGTGISSRISTASGLSPAVSAPAHGAGARPMSARHPDARSGKNHDDGAGRQCRPAARIRLKRPEMTMLRHLMAVLATILLTVPAIAQEAETAPPVGIDRSATGGAQTLEDILRRQQNQKIDDRFRSENIGGDAATVPELGPLGGASDADLWRALRYGKADITASTRNETGKVLVQDGGM